MYDQKEETERKTSKCRLVQSSLQRRTWWSVCAWPSTGETLESCKMATAEISVDDWRPLKCSEIK